MILQIVLTGLGFVGFFLLGRLLGPKLAVRLARRESARLLTTVQALTQQLQRTTAESQDWQRRAEENRKSIATVLKERDGWCRRYDDQSIGHGNAQVIMMDAISYLEGKLRAAGVEVQLSPIVRETQALYYSEHVEPALKRTGAESVRKPLPASKPVPE